MGTLIAFDSLMSFIFTHENRKFIEHFLYAVKDKLYLKSNIDLNKSDNENILDQT